MGVKYSASESAQLIQAMSQNVQIANHTLRKSNSDFVSFALPYSSTVYGSLPSLFFDFH